MPHRFSAEIRVSPLLEARVKRLATALDVDAYSAAIGELLATVPASEGPVLLADHRPVVVYSQAAADRLAELFSRMNARLVRVAILVSPTNATLSMQLERLVREASFSGRRVFQHAEPALEHLAPALTVAQLARARSFLSEFTQQSVPPRR